MIITIDGPVASGKSTVARLLAQHLGACYLNSGFIYRALAYLLCEHGYTPEQLKSIAIEKVKALVDLSLLAYVYHEGSEAVQYAGQDLTTLLKTPLIDQAASCLSTVPAIRALVNELLRFIAQDKDVVIDGRDAGSVIFADADYKFFLTAAPEIRARRWQIEQQRRGNQSTLQEALAEVNERDLRDRTRAVAPLVVPKDAHVIATDTEDASQVLDTMLREVKHDRCGTLHE